jgi:hypothetical protein
MEIKDVKKGERNADIRSGYEKSCDDYLRAFCEKHEYDYDDDAWVAGDVGGIAYVSDYFVGMETIRTDIDCDAPVDEFMKYQDYCLRAGYLDMSVPNFYAWLRCCPRKSNAELSQLERFKSHITWLEKELRKQIDDYKR